jgi:tRNA(Ile)-lysidine synthase
MTCGKEYPYPGKDCSNDLGQGKAREKEMVSGGTLHNVRKTIDEYALFTPGATIVVAVSGGADSVALLDMLASFRDLQLRLVVAHLNHCLRGEESDGDEAFVGELAERYHLRRMIRRVDVAALARERKVSLEMAGREARYRFFDEVARECGASATALAHHADDQAETVLMRLLRGTAGTGLAGMTPASHGGRYVRPLLGITRGDIESYLADRGLACRHDGSNDDPAHLRNRIRHQLLPLMAQYNPSIRARLADTAAALAADEQLLAEMTGIEFSRVSTTRDNGVVLDLRSLRTRGRGMRLRLYRRAIATVKKGLERISHRNLDAIDRLVLSAVPQSSIDLADGVLLRRCYEELFFCRGGRAAEFGPYEFLIPGSGTYDLPGGGRLRVDSPVAWEGGDHDSARQTGIDLDRAPFPWLVRTFRHGDRIVPSGMSGHKKVKEIFMEHKLPRELRQRLPLLLCGSDIIWIAGVRVSEMARARHGTARGAVVEILDFTH